MSFNNDILLPIDCMSFNYKPPLIIISIIFLATVILFIVTSNSTFLSKQSKTLPSPSKVVVKTTPTPTQIPLTIENVETQLDQIDKQTQETLNNVDADLNAISQIDASQDSTTGL